MIKKIMNNKIINNIGWLVIDKFLILFLQFFVGVKIANYYGGEIYGKYLYAVSLLAFSPILLEILNSRVIKKSFLKYKSLDVIESVCTLKILISIIIFFIVVSLKFLFPMDERLYLILIFLSLDNIFLTSTNGIELYFEYKLNSKYIVISNNIIKVISYLFQYIAVSKELDILFIPIIRASGDFIRFFIMRFNFQYIYKNKIKIKLKKHIIKEIFNESKYLWITYASYIIYTQIDRVMIRNMLGDRQVSVYTLANQLIMIISILLGPINVSLFPKLLEKYKISEKEYSQLYSYYNKLITIFYIIIGLLSIVVVKYLFPLIYSKEYLESINIYMILIIGVIFTANASLQAGHIAIINKTKQSVYKTLIGVVLNISLNLYLLSKIGVYGAAISTVMTIIVCNFGLDFFIKDYRKHAFIQLQSFNVINLFERRKKDEK